MQPDWFIPATGAGEFYTDEGCFITELMNSERAPDVSLALARVQPGVTTRLHALTGIVERYIVRRGRGRADIAGAEAVLSPGDQAVIPAGAAQRITNIGEEDLEFYCVCTPRFVPEAYIDLEPC